MPFKSNAQRKAVMAKYHYMKGWRKESKRHALAAKGIKTGKKITNLHNNVPINNKLTQDEYDRWLTTQGVDEPKLDSEIYKYISTDNEANEREKDIKESSDNI